jgi:hypothetical protein
MGSMGEGMPDQNQIELVQSRQREIADELARLQKEADELDIAMRVLNRLTNQKPQPRDGISTAAEEPKLGPPRPKGIPSNFDMVEMILASDEKEGQYGLTAKELVEKISGRYWPGLTGSQILPAIYQFAKKGRLLKTSAGKFKRIKKKEGSANNAAEPS